MPDPDKPTLLVIDGHSLAFRAFYALPVDSFTTRDGQHTNAIHGFLSMLLLLLQNEKPTHLAVAFDLSRQSFRTRDYDQYKANRGATPPEFAGQIPLLKESLAAMNVPVITKEDFEADDILATLSLEAKEDGFRVLLASGDRDTIQLVDDDVTLLYPNVRGVSELKVYDTAAVQERYGIRPDQYPEIAALVGETSDNLAGIDKVGEKTAVKWIQKYGTVDELLAHADEITGVVGQNLRDQQDRAVRNRRLNRLVRDVQLDTRPDELARKPIDAQAVQDIFTRLEFRTLLDRVIKLEGSAADAAAGLTVMSETTGIPAVSEPAADALASWLSAQSDPVGVRVAEFGDGIEGIGLSSLAESVWIRWSEKEPAIPEALATWLGDDAAPKRMHDAKRQVKALARHGVDVAGIEFDTGLAGWLLRPGSKADSLAEQVYRVLGEALVEPDPEQLVPDTDAVSPATEAWYVLRVADEVAERLDEGSLGVLRDIELPLVPVLARMELQGITVDAGVLGALNARLTAAATELAAAAFAEIGREVNLGSPKQLQEVLFDQLQMPKTRANKTGYSTDAASLADLQETNPHPFLGYLLEHRDATKLKQMVETLEKSIGRDSRVHTTYDQTGSSTGRMSSNDPNLQNIPIKTGTGREVRSAFRSGAGFDTLLTADYSQIEMRIMAHLSGDEGLIEAFNAGEDLHRFVGARIFHVEPADVTPTMRTKVKAMSYGLAYGLSAFGLSRQLRIETSEARELMADYFARFGAVRDYLRNVVEQARLDGYTTTIFGRRRPFTDLTSTNRVMRENAERQALNSPIQGSAADIIKRAMLGIDDDITRNGMRSRMLLQVHDELVLEVAPGELDVLSTVVHDRMAHAADLSVPLEVQVGTGPNWDAAAH